MSWTSRSRIMHLPAQFGRLSPELVCRAGKAGLGLELSLYSIQEGEGAEA